MRFRLSAILTVSLLLSACGGHGAGVLTPATSSTAKVSSAAHKANAACTLIDTVNPNSDFAGQGFTAASFNGGDHLTIDATGCTYGIYLSPGSKNLRIDHAKVNNASRVQIFAEQVSGVTIDDTVVDGTAFGRSPVKDGRMSSLGGIAFRGASGTVDNSRIYSTLGFGMNIVANNACYTGGGACLEPNVTVNHTLIDVSNGTSDGFDVIGGPLPLLATASINHSTVLGPNSATSFGAGEVDVYGAQVGYAFEDARIVAQYDAAINNQIGFESYCSTGLATLADLKDAHDRVSFATDITFPASPLVENQVLTAYTAAQIDAIFGPGSC